MKGIGFDDDRFRQNQLVRDALRGLRYFARGSAYKIANRDHKIIPKPIGNVITQVVEGVDHLLVEAESGADSYIAGPIRKTRIPDESFFGAEGFSPQAAQRDAAGAASALYFGLSYAAKRFDDRDMLISETICLDCINRFAAGAQPASTAQGASRLFDLVMVNKAFRDLDPFDGRSETTFAPIVSKAAFACCLWFFAPRDIRSMSEQELLDSCCEIVDGDAFGTTLGRADSKTVEREFERLLDLI